MAPRRFLTALQGFLFRGSDRWYWLDGSPEPRVHDVHIQSPAANYTTVNREGVSYVEIPSDYRAHIPPAATTTLEAIETLIHDHGRETEVHAGELARITGMPSLTVTGRIVPLSAWQQAMRAPRGAAWSSHHDGDIRGYARSLGFVEIAAFNGPD